MYGERDEWMDRQMNGKTDGRTEKQMDGDTGEWAYGWFNRQTDGQWADRLMDTLTDGQQGKQIDGYFDRRAT